MSKTIQEYEAALDGPISAYRDGAVALFRTLADQIVPTIRELDADTSIPEEYKNALADRVGKRMTEGEDEIDRIATEIFGE